ncbi:hypothetical protein PQX77_019525 [Marasmius sp. AFHP31]|nr:hypothetical protein PQX77_019525 [Marasmius sp. AFHP31]
MSDYAVLPPFDYDYNPKTLSYLENAGRHKPPYPCDGPGEPPKFPKEPLFDEDPSIDGPLEELDRYKVALQIWKDQHKIHNEERRKFLQWHKIYIRCEHAIESQRSNEDSGEDDGEMSVKSTKEVRRASASKRRADSDESDVEVVDVRISERLKTRKGGPVTKATRPPTSSRRVKTRSTEKYIKGIKNKGRARHVLSHGIAAEQSFVEYCGRCLSKGTQCYQTLSRSPSKEYKGKRCWGCTTSHSICIFEDSKGREPRPMKSGSRQTKVPDTSSDTKQDVSRVLRGLKRTINELQMKVDGM